jgi:hypothetical protein
MKATSASFFLLLAAAVPASAQFDGGLNTPRMPPPMCQTPSYKAANPSICNIDPRSPAQRMADEQRAAVRTFNNPATQVKVECPADMGLQRSAPPSGFTLQGSASSRVPLLIAKGDSNRQTLTCVYGNPATQAMLGSSNAYGAYDYSIAGKKCGFSAFPCDSGCFVVCDR